MCVCGRCFEMNVVVCVCALCFEMNVVVCLRFVLR